jgi:hypothetical protein
VLLIGLVGLEQPDLAAELDIVFPYLAEPGLYLL